MKKPAIASRARFREVFEGDPSRALPYKDIGNGIPFAGVEYYLPLFFDETATLFDYLADDTVTVTVGDIDDAMQRFGQDTASRYGFLKSDRERPVLPPSALFLDPETLHGKLKDFRRLALTAGQPHPDFRAAPDVSVARRAEDPVAKLRALVQGRQNRLLLCADSAGRRETLVQMLNEFGVTPDAQPDSIEAFLSSDAHFGIAAAPLSAGFGLPGAGLAFLTENDLYPGLATTGRRGKRDQERASNVEAMVRDLSELRAGDPVVHAQHGIGRYHGLVNMDMGEGEMEFLHLEYANGSTLYVPVSQLHVIARYSGADPGRAAAPAGLRPVGQGPPQGRQAGARHRRRAAGPVRAARRARRLCLQVAVERLRSLCRGLRLPKPPTRPPPSRR